MLKCQNLLEQMLTMVTTFHNFEPECSAYFEGEIQISFMKKKWHGGYPLRAMIHSFGVWICSEYIEFVLFRKLAEFSKNLSPLCFHVVFSCSCTESSYETQVSVSIQWACTSNYRSKEPASEKLIIENKRKKYFFLSICLHNIVSCGTSVEPLNYAKDTTTYVHVKI